MKVIIALLMVMAFPAFADNRPEKAERRDKDGIIEAIALGDHVKCSFTQSFLLQTEQGYSTPDEDDPKYDKKVLFKDLPAKPSSPHDFRTYSLSWEDEDFYFYFFMNSQVGAIEIKDKTTGFSARSNLDLSDFTKQEVYIGEAKLERQEFLDVSFPYGEEEIVPGMRFTTLTGRCHFLESFVP